MIFTTSSLKDNESGIKEINKLAKIPMKSESEMLMVDIIMLKFKQPEVETKCVQKIIENTNWPYKLTVYDNRLNTANTASIWNKLIRDSNCDYVCLIDSDAFVPKLEPCWLTRMMQSMTRPEIKVVVPVSNNCGGQHQKVLGAKGYPSEKLNNGIWSGFCFLFKKSAMEDVGWFDEQFYIYGSDSEWAYRWAKRQKGEVMMREDVLVEHIGSYSFNQDPIREMDKLRSGILYKLRTK